MKLRTKAQLKNVRQNHCRQANKKLKIYSSASIAANPMLPVVNFSTDILNNKNSKMSIQKVDIIGDRVYINGTIFIPKNSCKK